MGALSTISVIITAVITGCSCTTLPCLLLGDPGMGTLSSCFCVQYIYVITAVIKQVAHSALSSVRGSRNGYSI